MFIVEKMSRARVRSSLPSDLTRGTLDADLDTVGLSNDHCGLPSEAWSLLCVNISE